MHACGNDIEAHHHQDHPSKKKTEQSRQRYEDTMALSTAPPSTMQQAPDEANAKLGSVLSRALELSSAPSSTTAESSETSTSGATTVSTESSRSSSRSSSPLGLASVIPTSSSSNPAVCRLSSGESTAMQMQRRSGRSRTPSSKAVESRANAAALAAVGLRADEYDAFVEDPPTTPTTASSSRSSSTASSPIPDAASSFATSSVATVSPKSGKKTWKKPEGKPKRPLSAYNVFFKEERARLVSEINGSGSGSAQTADQRQSEAQATALQRSHRKTHGMGFAGLAQNIAGKWKSLSAKNRKPFEDKAAVDKARYVREVAAWKALLQEGAARAAEAEADRQAQLKDLYRQQQITSAPATPRSSAQPVTDSSSEDETPRRRAARSKKAAAAKKKGKGKSGPKKAKASKRTAKHQPKSAKNQRGRANATAQHHQEQPVHQIPNLAMLDPADVPAVFEPAAISVQHYQHQPHQEVQQAIAAAAAQQQQGHGAAPAQQGQSQQWDGLDQMMMGAVGHGDLQDILSLDF